MLGQFISLYKARKDPALAKRIASEMVVDGVIERASWPIVIAKFWLSIAIVVMAVMICALLTLAATTHWSVGIIALPLAGVIYAIVKLWRGVNGGIEYVSDLAKTEIKKRTSGAENPESPAVSQPSPAQEI